MAGNTIDSFDPASVGAVNRGPIDSSPEINAATDRVRDAGAVRFWRDDLDVRTDVFAQEALALGEDAPQLVAELLDQDPGAISYINVHHLNERLEAGMITQREYDASIAAIAGAYSDGSIGYHNMADMMGFKDAAFFYDGGAGQWPMEFKDALDSAAADPTLTNTIEQFRRDLAKDILDGDLPSMIPADAEPSAGAVALAVEVLADNGPRAVADMLASLPAEAREFTLARASSVGVSNIYLERGGHTNAGDTLKIITDSINATGNHNLALEVVRFANGEGRRDFYEGVTALPERAEIMGELFIAHSDEILDEFTLGSQVGSANSDATELGRNLSDLSNLLRLTAFNPSNPNHAQAAQALTDYTATLVADYNTLNGKGDLTRTESRQLDALEQRIISVGASVQHVYRSANQDNQAIMEMRKAMASVVIDLALVAVPLNGRAESAVANEISGLFAGDAVVGSAIERVLKDFNGDLFKAGTGILKDDVRDALVESLGDNSEIVAELFVGADNFLLETVLNVIETPHSTSREAYQTLDQIDNSR